MWHHAWNPSPLEAKEIEIQDQSKLHNEILFLQNTKQTKFIFFFLASLHLLPLYSSVVKCLPGMSDHLTSRKHTKNRNERDQVF